MIIGIAGYHSSGKSDLSEFFVNNYSWRHVVKRELLREWSSVDNNEEVFTEWYRDLYHNMGSYEIMHHLLRLMKYDRNSKDVVLLDAIHTPDEWKAVLEIEPEALLVSVVVPKKCRLSRSTPEDMALDIKRERFWHSHQTCLLAQVEWSFSGVASEALRALEADALVDHLKSSGRI